MSHDDVLHCFRLRLFALARELVNVRAACRAMGVHHSTFYRWRCHTLTWGLEALRPRERRRPWMPNQLPPHVEHRVLAFCLAYPGHGPRRVAAELARERWGGMQISPNGAYKCLRRHGLSTRKDRLALVAGYAAPPEPPKAPEPERHLDAPHPGSLVGMDCFYVGRLQGTKRTVWQYAAIDVHSGYGWAELHTSDRNPRETTAPLEVGRPARMSRWVAPRAVTVRVNSPFLNSEPLSVLTAWSRHPRAASSPATRVARRRLHRTNPGEVLAPNLRPVAGP